MKFPFMNQNKKQAAVPPVAGEEQANRKPEQRLHIEVLEPRVAPILIQPGK